MARPTSQKTIVSRLFSASDRPIYILDAGGRIVYANQALADWLVVEADKLPGMKCVWSGDTDNAINRLAVPAHAKDLPEFKSAITLPDTSRQATFIALNDHEEFGATLVIVDETEAAGGSQSATNSAANESPFDVDALHAELVKLRVQWTEPYKLDCILGTSPAIQQVRSQVRLASQTNANVVVVGKPGSDRESIARTIHAERSQGKTPLVPMSCWLVDAEQMQKTLVEFVRHRKETGEAGMPTLLLIDVDDLDIEAQVVLRSTLAASDFTWRIVSTAKRSLNETGVEPAFLIDLAFALTDLEINIPPLSERLEDISPLAQSILEASQHADRRSGFDPDAIELLLRYSWPGEIGELREVISEAATKAKSSLIARDDLPQKLKYAEDADALPDVEPEKIQLDEFLGEVESELIRRAIKSAKGNRAQAARNLGISRGKLLRRIEQLGIEANENRDGRENE